MCAAIEVGGEKSHKLFPIGVTLLIFILIRAYSLLKEARSLFLESSDEAAAWR